MQIKEIIDDHDLDAALRRIDVIIDAPDGSPEAKELDALGSLVHAYETRRYPLQHVSSIADK